jgi:hypothetical protein
MLRADVQAWWPDGRTQRLTPDGFHFQACVHPEGRDAVWWGAPDGLPRIWRSDVGDGAATEPEAIGPIGARHPAYGLSGDRIVFAAEPHGTAHETVERTFAEAPGGNPLPGTVLNLYSMTPDGSDVRQLTDGAHQDQRPCLSPDGSTVVFVSDRDGLGLYRVPADDSAAPQPLGVLGYRPWFAVDGESLFYFTFVSIELRQIHRLRFDGSPPEPLANDAQGWSHGPFADPGGASVLCHSNRGEGWRLYELPLDGSPAEQLRPPGFDDTPCGHVTRARNGVATFDAMWTGGMN